MFPHRTRYHQRNNQSNLSYKPPTPFPFPIPKRSVLPAIAAQLQKNSRARTSTFTFTYAHTHSHARCMHAGIRCFLHSTYGRAIKKDLKSHLDQLQSPTDPGRGGFKPKQTDSLNRCCVLRARIQDVALPIRTVFQGRFQGRLQERRFPRRESGSIDFSKAESWVNPWDGLYHNSKLRLAIPHTSRTTRTTRGWNWEMVM